MNIQSTICPSRTRPRFLRFFCNIPSSYLMLRVPGGESHVVNCHRRFDEPSFNHFFFSQKCYVLTISFAFSHVYLGPQVQVAQEEVQVGQEEEWVYCWRDNSIWLWPRWQALLPHQMGRTFRSNLGDHNQSGSRIKWVPFFDFFLQPYRLHLCCTRTADTKPTPNRKKGVEVENRLVKRAPRRGGECLFLYESTLLHLTMTSDVDTMTPFLQDRVMEYIVEEIVECDFRRKGRNYYYIKWEGYEDRTWEPLSNLDQKSSECTMICFSLQTFELHLFHEHSRHKNQLSTGAKAEKMRAEWLEQHPEDEVRALFAWQYIWASNYSLMHWCHDAIFAGKGNE